MCARTIRELAGLRRAADEAGKRLSTLTLETEIKFASAHDRAAFAKELANGIAQLSAKYHQADAPTGRVHRILTLAYPKPALDHEKEQRAP